MKRKTKAVPTKDHENTICIGHYRCKKCGYEFLAQHPHPCPKCQPAKFRKWKKQQESK